MCEPRWDDDERRRKPNTLKPVHPALLLTLTYLNTLKRTVLSLSLVGTQLYAVSHHLLHVMSSSFWSDACIAARNKPVQAQLDVIYATHSVTVKHFLLCRKLLFDALTSRSLLMA